MFKIFGVLHQRHFIALVNVLLVTVSRCDFVTKDRLIFVQIICRHGDRSPEWIPVESSNMWPVKAGQLTPLGMHQASQVGKYFKKQYVDIDKLINESYDPFESRFFATSTDRTKQTVLLIASTMYNNTLNLSCFPIPYSMQEFDIAINWNTFCPAYDNYLRDVVNSDNTQFAKNFNRNHEYIISELSNRLQTRLSFRSLYRAYDLFLTEAIHKIRRPYVNESIFQFVRQAALTSLQQLISKTYKSHLRFSPGFHLIFKNFEKKLDKTLNANMLMYVAHDVTIHGWLHWLCGDKPNTMVGYVAFISMELYALTPISGGNDRSKSYQHGIKIYMYKGTHSKHFTVRRKDITYLICKGQKYCSISELKAILKPLFMMDYEKECKSATFTNLPVNLKLIFILFVVIVYVQLEC
ncbi:hypothetical protein GJ496_005564 [Pomphorhynchus laevis]|nr:hypothetical protein GJ496_005564 [Pomphorhynchus laevis]